MLAHGEQAGVEFGAGIANLVEILHHHLLTPTVRDREQQCDERNGRSDDDAAFHAEIEQGWIMLQSRAEERFERQERDDEFGRAGQALPI